MPQLLGHVANKCLGPARLDTGLGLSPDALPKAMGSSLLTAPTVFSTLEMTTTLCGQRMLLSILLSDTAEYAPFPSFTSVRVPWKACQGKGLCLQPMLTLTPKAARNIVIPRAESAVLLRY